MSLFRLLNYIIRGEIKELAYYANEDKLQLIIVTKSWLSADIPNEIIDISEHRPTLVSKDRHNGFGGQRNIRDIATTSGNVEYQCMVSTAP